MSVEVAMLGFLADSVLSITSATTMATMTMNLMLTMIDEFAWQKQTKARTHTDAITVYKKLAFVQNLYLMMACQSLSMNAFSVCVRTKCQIRTQSRYLFISANGWRWNCVNSLPIWTKNQGDWCVRMCAFVFLRYFWSWKFQLLFPSRKFRQFLTVLPNNRVHSLSPQPAVCQILQWERKKVKMFANQTALTQTNGFSQMQT